MKKDLMQYKNISLQNMVRGVKMSDKVICFFAGLLMGACFSAIFVIMLYR